MNPSELKSKQHQEQSFFDKTFKSQKQSDYYSIGFTSLIFEMMMEKLGNIKGKKVLDFGCGQGRLLKD